MLDERKWSRINQVFGLRIDHHMMPDVKSFFSCLAPVLDESADFVFTVVRVIPWKNLLAGRKS